MKSVGLRMLRDATIGYVNRFHASDFTKFPGGMQEKEGTPRRGATPFQSATECQNEAEIGNN